MGNGLRAAGVKPEANDECNKNDGIYFAMMQSVLISTLKKGKSNEGTKKSGRRK
jgi:hypothetical protein